MLTSVLFWRELTVWMSNFRDTRLDPWAPISSNLSSSQAFCKPPSPTCLTLHHTIYLLCAFLAAGVHIQPVKMTPEWPCRSDRQRTWGCVLEKVITTLVDRQGSRSTEMRIEPSKREYEFPPRHGERRCAFKSIWIDSTTRWFHMPIRLFPVQM